MAHSGTTIQHIILLLSLILFPAMEMKAYERDSLYNAAYIEMAEMLDGKRPISIKKAVFLAEWAYLDGNLDYENDMCKPVAAAADFIRRLLTANNVWSYKTAKQIGLIDFFFKPWSGNGHTPFTYDFGEELPRDDFRQQFVTRTLRTHKGQCRSLPWTFKIIAEELGAEVYINRAPRHCYITYPDLDDLFPEDTVNVELTTHHFTPTWCIKEEYSIKDEAVAAGTYMTPLTDIELVACQLSELAYGYWIKYDKLYDEFTLKCCLKSLEYYPMDPGAILTKGHSYERLLHKHLFYTMGYVDSYAEYLWREMDKCYEELEATHWTYISDEESEKFYDRSKDYKPIVIEKNVTSPPIN